MRKYDIPYVPNGPVNYYPAKSLQEMTLVEIKKKYIKTCAKANGDVSECSKCKTPCPEGKRAIQLIANEIYNDPPVPLYGGKTLIERAREVNAKRKADKTLDNKQDQEVNITKKKRIYIANWYEKAMASEDPVKWIMETYGCDKAKAKQKIWDQRYKMKKQGKQVNIAKPSTENSLIKEESSIENKLDLLMKEQENQKKTMEEYMRLYEEAKKRYDEIKQKTDVLCNAMDILNE